MSESERIDQIILDIAHQAGQIPRGKTITAGSFPETQAAIAQMLREARSSEREQLSKELLPIVSDFRSHHDPDDLYMQLQAALSKQSKRRRS